MSELAAFQRQFADQLAQPPVAASPVQVYVNTVLLGAIDALAGNYPVTREIVGPRSFEALALAFARANPPQGPVLALYGHEFPDWLAQQGASRELPYLVDVARCEQLHYQALFAPDAPVLDSDALAALTPERLLALRLQPHPATRFGWFTTPAMAIWLAHQQGLDGEFAPEWRSGGAIFARPGVAVCGLELDSPSHRLLAGMRMGETLGAAAQAAASLYPDADIGAGFGRLVNCGAFAALSN